MKKFTAKIEVPGKPAKYLTNCIIYKGKLVQVYKKGVGESHTEGGMFNGEGDTWEVYESYEDAYRTYFNQTLLKENGLTREEAVKLIEEDEKNAFKDERLFNSMFVLGKNPNGYEVINIDEEKEEKEKKEEKERFENFINKTEPIPFYSGIFGYKTVKLPREIWEIIKPFAEYHKGGEEDYEWADDMGYIEPEKHELKGWFYSLDAISELLDKNYPVTYEDKPVKKTNDIIEIIKKRKKEIENFYKAQKEFNKAKDLLLQKRNKLFSEGKYLTENEAEKIKKLPKIHYQNSVAEGQDIYGGGWWFHKDSSNLYIVKNNGHDGDNWSYNNYGTGGAGAIAVSVPLSGEIKEFLNECKEFESKTIKDFLN